MKNKAVPKRKAVGDLYINGTKDMFRINHDQRPMEKVGDYLLCLFRRNWICYLLCQGYKKFLDDLRTDDPGAVLPERGYDDG